MEVLSNFKLRQVDDIRDEEIDEEDSFFDLVLESSSCCANKKDFDEKASPKPISPVTPLPSTPKLKVFILSFKKRSKSTKTEFKTSRTEEFPNESVFVDNSLRSQMLRETYYEASEKSIPKYLKLIRPFYTKATKKAKVTTISTPSCSPVVNLSQRRFSEEGRIGSFKIVARKLVRSRSTSAAIRVPPLQRRDDMLMEQQDGIQAAILHCKNSYFSSCEEQKRFSI